MQKNNKKIRLPDKAYGSIHVVNYKRSDGFISNGYYNSDIFNVIATHRPNLIWFESYSYEIDIPNPYTEEYQDKKMLEKMLEEKQDIIDLLQAKHGLKI